jgi:hypothetical protein
MDELIEDMGLAIADTGPDGCEGGADAFRACRRDLCSCRSAARAALAAINARGDRVVPELANVTNPMRSAVVAGYENSKTYSGVPTVAAWDFFALGYTAMLSASPYAPEETK